MKYLGSSSRISTVNTLDPSNPRSTRPKRQKLNSGIERVSAIGGRSAATALIDAGLVSDLYLTTSPNRAGVPDTPFYTGTRPPRGRLVVHKQTSEGVMFDHFVLPVQY